MLDQELRELQLVLSDHAKRYPLMQPCDAVKLIYQNEFGGEHLITDEKGSLQRLREEFDRTPRDPAQPMLEEIGNGIVRVMLAGMDPDLYSVDALNRAFLLSASYHKGSRPAFLEKLKVLRRMTVECRFGFTYGDLEAYLEQYAATGYPLLSHSKIYEQSYRPAYRVVERKML